MISFDSIYLDSLPELLNNFRRSVENRNKATAALEDIDHAPFAKDIP